MHQGLPTQGEGGHERMGVDIAGQQEPLKEQHTHGPDGWDSPKPWEQSLRHNRLHLKEEKSTHRDGHRYGKRSEARSWHTITLCSVSRWLLPSPPYTDRRRASL
jgi:hypothetical protein